MHLPEKWIWLPKKDFPGLQVTNYNHTVKEDRNYAVAEFIKAYSFPQKVVSMKVIVSGDTFFEFYLNGNMVCTGPAGGNGDFLLEETVKDNYYSFEVELTPNSCTLDFFARVRTRPWRINEFSKGHGGFMMSALLTFEDGTSHVICTDETWSVRLNKAFTSPLHYDGRLSPTPYVAAELVENRWHAAVAPIPPLAEETIRAAVIEVAPNEEKTVNIDLDRIYCAYVGVEAEAAGEVSVEIACSEIGEDAGDKEKESFVFSHNEYTRGLTVHSIGKMVAKIKNSANTPARITVDAINTHYPVASVAKIQTSRPDIDIMLDVCRHTLKICRQTHHLDSPRHCEPLACTGDYYIETLMTVFSFGDMRLAEFDLLRTAEFLRVNDGRMFHTSYSLIFVSMLWDVYMMTGNVKLLEDCLEAVMLLLQRFRTYIGDNGLIETPPDYMFIDWIYIDGHSMHHPPKALGQTCLNMYYFGALTAASKIFNKLGLRAMANDCITKREALREAINTLLFDSEKQIYFEGLNTPTPEELLYYFMFQNTDKRYYLKHSNILAAYYGVCDEALARDLIKKIMTDEIEGDVQPYFLHYLFEAIYSNGLRDEYTLPLTERWVEPVLKCPKGLVEGFVMPEPTYSFDHSHAWGGTPLYSLPKALTGLAINKPNYEEITLSPSLCGLENAYVELPTPYGMVKCTLAKDQPARITYPKGIKVNVIDCGDYILTEE